MKKTLKNLTAALVLLTLLLSLTGCGVGYCSVSGCPKESMSGSDYCPEHKCFNSSCDNRAVGSYSYCTKCFDRAAY